MQIHKQVGQKEKECALLRRGYLRETEKDFHALIVCCLLLERLYNLLMPRVERVLLRQKSFSNIYENPDLVPFVIFFRFYAF